MKSKLKFIWIDDEPSRKTMCRNLGERLQIEAEFKDIENKELMDELDKLLKARSLKPDLLLMDHRLNKVKNGTISTGSSVTEIIREKWPECPIVCVTGVEQKDIDLHKKSIYEEVISISELSRFDSSLLAIAKSFRLLNRNRPANIDELLQLLKVPVDDIARLKTIIPYNLKKNYSDKSLLMTISRWVRHTLMGKPGFLYDRLWTATLLGIRNESFAKVEKQFKKAQYNGIFADDSNERWWQSKIREILFANFPDSKIVLPWELGRKIPDIRENDYSVCYYCEKSVPAPEILAYVDDSSTRREPMHLRCTIPHPQFEKSLYFEEIRMMKGE